MVWSVLGGDQAINVEPVVHTHLDHVDAGPDGDGLYGSDREKLGGDDKIRWVETATLGRPIWSYSRNVWRKRGGSQIAIKAEIERSLTDPALGPQALLDKFGITRSTLYRMFEPSGGVAAYIAKRRLQLAFRRITDPAESGLRFSQLAFDLGFSHASAFTRAFGEFFGMSPKDAKALAVRPEELKLEFLLSPEGRPYIHPVRSLAAPLGKT